MLSSFVIQQVITLEMMLEGLSYGDDADGSNHDESDDKDDNGYSYVYERR